MTDHGEQVGQLLSTPDLAGVLESDRFRQFLDQVPIAIAVSELNPAERVVYANIEFERLTGQAAVDLEGKPWTSLRGCAAGPNDERPLSEALVGQQDYIGPFAFENGGEVRTADAWSNIIQDDDGAPVFRLVALVGLANRSDVDVSDFEQHIRDKDLQLRELQHRVANNLQMITALLRIEARNVPDGAKDERFDRLAGRIEALGLLYRALSDEGTSATVDLGAYLSQVASAVIQAHAIEGIHLDLQVDTWPVSINVAMPAGLVVNELLTNALKHAFKGRDGGVVMMHSLVDDAGCRVIVADDGVGLPPGSIWPPSGKLSNLIVVSLRQNANAQVKVDSQPGKGLRVTIFFRRADAVPQELD